MASSYQTTGLEHGLSELGLQPKDSESSRVNIWRLPREPNWTSGDGADIKQFYDDRVKINRTQWQRNCEYVDHLLDHIFAELRTHADKSYPVIQLQKFVRQGSAREGVKVSAADEFDAVLPFRFVLLETDIVEAPTNSLPPGIAEIKVTKVKKAFKPASLVKTRGTEQYIDTEVFHSAVFLGLIDKIVEKFKKGPVEMRVSGRPVSFTMTRKSHPPSFILNVVVSEVGSLKTAFSLDVVPGFLVSASSSKKFLVTRWIPKSQNDKLEKKYPDPATAWRISLSHFEMQVFEDNQDSNDEVFLRLIAAYRILKALQSARDTQFKSVMKSYHLKNVFLYCFLYIKKNNQTPKSITEALAYLVAVTDTALSKSFLPQFFTDKLGLKTFFSNETQHKPLALDNLLIEKSSESLNQAQRDMKRVIEDHHLGSVLAKEFRGAVQFFEGRLKS